MTILKSFADLTIVPRYDAVAAAGTSGSSRIKHWITSHAEPFPQFTSKELSTILGVTFGAVSGFIAKLESAGAAEKIGRREGAVLWRVDRSAVENVSTKKTPGRGSQPGRTKGGSGRPSVAHLPDITPNQINKEGSYDVVSALLEAAAYLEAHKPSLEDFTTSELIDELHRRTHSED